MTIENDIAQWHGSTKAAGRGIDGREWSEYPEDMR